MARRLGPVNRKKYASAIRAVTEQVAGRSASEHRKELAAAR